MLTNLTITSLWILCMSSMYVQLKEPRQPLGPKHREFVSMIGHRPAARHHHHWSHTLGHIIVGIANTQISLMAGARTSITPSSYV